MFKVECQICPQPNSDKQHQRLEDTRKHSTSLLLIISSSDYRRRKSLHFPRISFAQFIHQLIELIERKPRSITTHSSSKYIHIRYPHARVIHLLYPSIFHQTLGSYSSIPAFLHTVHPGAPEDFHLAL